MAQLLRTAACSLALFVTSARAHSAVGRASQDVASPPAAYPDTPKGLQDFLEAVFAAIKANDKTKIDSLWQSTQLPGHAAWFARIFSDKEGAALEAAYTRRLGSTASQPGRTYEF